MFGLLAISDRRSLADGDLPGWLSRLGAAGVDAVQIREKDLDDCALWEIARAARAMLPSTTRLLVNGRADIAFAAGADGVHLPSDGVPPGALRRRFGPGLLLGVSTHTVDEVERARDAGADYATFGPVWETPGKGTATGTGALARAAASGLPVFALGGVTIDRFGEAAAAGAAGVAAIRLFQRLSDLSEAVAAARHWFPA
ncbi:MAG TPA: thiamine phosphate synthase [Thermoanaerobaculia bacterium]|nr:thiamine phosphate synthase [Thermoanaerobaculia bacterium]